MGEIAKRNAPAHELASFMQAVLRDPAVPADKLEMLWRMRKELLAEEQREEYDAAFSQLQGEIQQVRKNGMIDLSGKGLVKFARWEDIDTHIRPLLARHGFDLSFTIINRDDGKFVARATLTRNGHSRSADSPALPADIGPGRNGLQAAGSATSYARRYAAEFLLNIVRRGEDDDGSKGANNAPVTADQVKQLQKLIKETKTDLTKFLEWSRTGATALTEIPAREYVRLLNALNDKKRKGQANVESGVLRAGGANPGAKK